MRTGTARRKGLRVLEEVARLVREDAANAAVLKQLRHELADILSSLDRQTRLASRSTENDVGTGITSPREASREDIHSLVSAECSRVGEALRSLEEFSKLIDAAASARFKQLRYQATTNLHASNWPGHATPG